MTIIKVLKKYDINPDGKFCGDCNYSKEYQGWITAYHCEAFDMSLEYESSRVGWPGGYKHKPLRCKQCLKKLKVK